MIVLKDGSTTTDRRLDRLISFDERSKNYPIRTLVGDKPLRSYTWALNTKLDQGPDGACVGFSWAHEMAARPAVVAGVTYDTAFSIYHDAQRVDEWPGGSYPGADPFYEGSSILGGAKAVASRGNMTEYRWAFNLNDALLAIGYQGPGVLGCYWYSGMFNPDANGFIRPTGYIAGGHAILVRGVSVKNRRVLLSNSWGTSWGMNGDCYMTFEDFESLLMNQGEFCIPVRRVR